MLVVAPMPTASVASLFWYVTVVGIGPSGLANSIEY